MFRFGLNIAPENAPANWGARAIFHQDRFELVHDRQQFEGEAPHRRGLAKMLNGGFLKMAQEAWAKAVEEGLANSYSAGEVVLVDSFFLKMVADTKGSCGYVYLQAWIKPGGYTEGGEANTNGLIWSCPETPQIGEVITISKQYSQEGLGEVLCYAEEHGHLFAIVNPINPDSDWRTQCQNRFGGSLLTNVMGREWGRFVPYGTKDILDAGILAGLKQTPDREERRAAMREHLRQRDQRHQWAQEVYVVSFAKDGGDCYLFDRQYEFIGRLPKAQAKALLRDSDTRIIGMDHSSPVSRGPACRLSLWIVHKDSQDAQNQPFHEDTSTLIEAA